MVKLLLFGHVAHSEKVKEIVNYALTRKQKQKLKRLPCHKQFQLSLCFTFAFLRKLS